MLKIEWQDCDGECIPEIRIVMDCETALDLVHEILSYNTIIEFNGTLPVKQEFRTDNGIPVNFVLVA